MEEVLPKVTRILIADDHAMFIDGIKSLLRKFDKAEIVAEANDGQEALEILKDGGIDMLVTDINMPGMSGTEFTKIVKSDFPEVKVLVLTMYNDREIINEILLAEAEEGYILKNTGKQELITAINRLADDGTYYSNKPPKPEDDRVKDLTPRELEILQLICEELSTAEISQKLYISPRTVETHRKHIIQKTQVKTIVGLIKLAIENKLV